MYIFRINPDICPYLYIYIYLYTYIYKYLYIYSFFIYNQSLYIDIFFQIYLNIRK